MDDEKRQKFMENHINICLENKENFQRKIYGKGRDSLVVYELKINGNKYMMEMASKLNTLQVGKDYSDFNQFLLSVVSLPGYYIPNETRELTTYLKNKEADFQNKMSERATLQYENDLSSRMNKIDCAKPVTRSWNEYIKETLLEIFK